jgi:hypothetical protein
MGVKVMDLDDGDWVAAVDVIPAGDDAASASAEADE